MALAGGEVEVSLTVLSTGILYWLASAAGLVLTGYVLVRWRRSARACYPMPLRRRKGYLSGLLLAFSLMLAPLSLRPDRCASCAQQAPLASVAGLVSEQAAGGLRRDVRICPGFLRYRSVTPRWRV